MMNPLAAPLPSLLPNAFKVSDTIEPPKSSRNFHDKSIQFHDDDLFCDCGNECGSTLNQRWHDCSIAEKLFKKFSPDTITKLASFTKYETLVQHTELDNGAVKITIDIRPKLFNDYEIRMSMPEQPYFRSACLPVNANATNIFDGEATTNILKLSSSEVESDMSEPTMEPLPTLPMSDDEPFLDSEGEIVQPKKRRKRRPRKFPPGTEHDKPGSFPCDEFGCDKVYRFSSALRRHKRAEHLQIKYHCPEPGCGKVFGQMHHLKRHIQQIHTNERPYTCSFCNNSFKNPYTLKCHIRIHTGERPYVCEEPGCGKAFNQKGAFNVHKKRHMEQKGIVDNRPPHKNSRPKMSQPMVGEPNRIAGLHPRFIAYAENIT